MSAVHNLFGEPIPPRPEPIELPTVAPLDPRVALDALNRAGVRLSKLPGSPPIVACPRSTWTAAVAAALDLFSYTHARVVLIAKRYSPGDRAVDIEVLDLLKRDQVFHGTAEVSLDVKWLDPLWPERVGGFRPEDKQ